MKYNIPVMNDNKFGFMKGLDILTRLVAIVGALNWGSIGISDWNMVERVFGHDPAQIIFTVVGLSGLVQLLIFLQGIFDIANDNQVTRKPDQRM